MTRHATLTPVTSQKLATFIATAMMVMTMFLSSSQSAHAAAYTKWVDAPERKDGQIVGMADVNTDCEGTLGCYSYIKIEYQWLYSGFDDWYDQNIGWDYVSGKWADQGVNEVQGSYIGCGRYRTVVDTYNDMLGGPEVGVNLGIVEFNLGGGIKRYHKETVSEPVEICGPDSNGGGGW